MSIKPSVRVVAAVASLALSLTALTAVLAPSSAMARAGWGLFLASSMSPNGTGHGVSYVSDSLQPKGRSVWRLMGSDSVGKQGIAPSQSGARFFQVQARGHYCKGWPIMEVTYDGNLLFRTPVKHVFNASRTGIVEAPTADSAYIQYFARVSAALGSSHRFHVKLANPYRDSTCDRKLFVDFGAYSYDAALGAWL